MEEHEPPLSFEQNEPAAIRQILSCPECATPLGYLVVAATTENFPSEDPDSDRQQRARSRVLEITRNHPSSAGLLDLTDDQYTFIVKEAELFSLKAPNKEASQVRFRNAVLGLLGIAKNAADREVALSNQIADITDSASSNESRLAAEADVRRRIERRGSNVSRVPSPEAVVPWKRQSLDY